MNPAPVPEIGTGLVDDLFALPTLQQRSALLHAASMLDADGLERLLDIAERWVHEDPGKAHRLAALCADVAGRASAPAAVPRAAYVRTQTYNANGEFEAGLRMAEEAYEGYVALGMNLEALRTYVGRMPAFNELGQYQEALDAAQIVLDALDGIGEPQVKPTEEQSLLLNALVHQNRGLCYEYMGRYEEALDAYAVAELRYRALGMSERLGEILDNRGRIFLHLGRGNEALAAHEAASTVFAEAGLSLSHAKALSNIGEANRRLGNYTRALGAFEQATRLLESLEALVEKACSRWIRRTPTWSSTCTRKLWPPTKRPASCCGVWVWPTTERGRFGGWDRRWSPPHASRRPRRRWMRPPTSSPPPTTLRCFRASCSSGRPCWRSAMTGRLRWIRPCGH